MIVTCEQCKSRFKIPDEKVTEKGVKVKCAKCAHVFRVSREPAAEADPFAKFAGGPTPAQTDLLPPVPPAAPKPPPTVGVFDFSSLVPPTSPSAPAAAAPGAFDFSALVPPSAAPLDVAALAPPAVPKSAPAAAVAPMAFDFSTLGAAIAPPPPPPKPKPQPAKAAEATAAFDFSALGASPAVSPPARSPVPSAPKPAPPPARSRWGAPHRHDEWPVDGLERRDRCSRRVLSPRPSPGSTSAARDELFDMAAAERVPPPAAPVAPEPELRLTSDELAPPKAAPAPVRALPRMMPLPKGRTLTALGVVANLVVAVVLISALAVVGTRAAE